MVRPCQRVVTRRDVYIIPFGMMGWVDSASLSTGCHPSLWVSYPCGMIGVSDKWRGGVSTVNELLGGESVYLYIYGGEIGGASSF